MVNSSSNSEESQISVVYFGADQFGVSILGRLTQENDFLVKEVICPFPQKKGRSRELSPTPLENFARQKNLKVTNVDRNCDLEKLDCDFLVVVAFGFLLKRELLEMPRRSSVCVHPSLLPKWRGASPIQNQILKGDLKVGTSIFLVEEKLDSGDILNQKEISLAKEDDYYSLAHKLEQVSAELLPQTLRQMSLGKITPRSQDESQSTYCQKINKSDGEINFKKDSSDFIDRKMKAFKKWPGIFFFHRGKRVQIKEMVIRETAGEGSIFIPTTDNKFVEILELQLEGKRALSAADFLAGNQGFFSDL